MPKESNGTAPEDTYVPALDDGGDEVEASSTEEAPNEEAQDGDVDVSGKDENTEPLEIQGDENLEIEGDEYDPDQPQYTGNARLDALIDHFAAQVKHLNPSNPQHLKTLRRMAEKELYIIEQREEIKRLKGVAKENDALSDDDGLTEFEKNLLAPEKPADKPADKPEDKPAAAAPVDFTYNDVGKDWKGADDAYEALVDAWKDVSEAKEKGKPAKMDRVNEIEAAIFQRRFDGIAWPIIAHILPGVVKKVIQAELGSVMPTVNQTAERERLGDAREFALAQLAETKGYEDIDSLVTEEEGPPVAFDGGVYPNTPLNRMIRDMPDLLDIKAEHRDPQVAARLTFLKRLRAAYKLWKQGTLRAGRVKQAMKAGAKLTARREQDRTRQTVNAGGKATGLPSGRKPASGSYAASLNKIDGEGSFASL